jgi:DNA-binding NarL/FixJ family response regulator
MLESVLPELNGPDSAREIRRVSPHTRVLAFTERPDKQQVLRMLAAGAKGYLLKSCGRKELLQALDVVVGGGTYLSPQIASIVVEGCMGEGRPITPLADKMSVRERQILQLIAEGRSTKVIASMLCVSPRTIDSHRLRIMSKLNVDSVAGLTKQAINMGLTTLLC